MCTNCSIEKTLYNIQTLLVLKMARNDLVNIRAGKRFGTDFVEASIVSFFTLRDVRCHGYDQLALAELEWRRRGRVQGVSCLMKVTDA